MKKTEGKEAITQEEPSDQGKYDTERIEYIKEECCIRGEISARAAKREQPAWNMMEHNHIYGLASFDYYYVNDFVCFRYDISDYQQLSVLIEKKKINFEMLFFLCREIFFIMEKASEYFLKEEQFLLRPEWIFGDLFQKKLVLCYLPGRGKQERKESLLFLEFFMEHIEHKDKQMVEFIYGLYDLVGTEHASLEEILCFIDTWGEKSIENTGTNEFQKAGSKNMRNEKQEKEMVWLLGRESESDIFVPFMTVSRKHLQIMKNKEGCFIMDLSSKNGTSLNGKRLLPMQRVKCTEKDILCVGGLSFSLHIASSEIKLCNISGNSNKILRALQKTGF